MSSIAIRRAAPANVVNAAVATAQVFTLASNPQLPCIIGVPGALAIEGKRFTVRAEGNAHTAGAFTCTASLLAALAVPAAPLVAANWTLLGSGTARAIATTWATWWIEANMIFDSNGGLLQGTFSQQVNNLFDGSAPLANVLTGINGSNLPVTQGGVPVQPTNPAFFLAVALTFGTAGANTGSIYNFEAGY
jgi:hypothetical protein